MEKKILLTNNDIPNTKNEKNIILINQAQIKSRIKNYKITNSELFPKKSETKFYTKINNQINKPKRYQRNNSKEIQDNNTRKQNKKEIEKIKMIITDNPVNKTEIRTNNKNDDRIKNIKVNKINFDKMNIQNKKNIFSNTNPNHQCLNSIYLTNLGGKNKNNLNNIQISNDYDNNVYLSTLNQMEKKTSFSGLNYKYNNKTTIVKKKLVKDSIKFKDIKKFLAHIDIFLSLFLKKTFKHFLNQIAIYKKILNNERKLNNNAYKVNDFLPIVNVNNAHCSLYCSINVNQDKLINTLLNNQNFNNFSDNTHTPISKRKQNKIQNNILRSNENNTNKRNKNISINPIGLNFNTESFNKDKNNFLIMTQKTIDKYNNDLINKENIFDQKESNINDNIKISPIKEMNINLGQLNLSKLNDSDNHHSNLSIGNKSNYKKINFNNKNDYEINLLNKIKNSDTDLYHNNLDKNQLKKIKSVKNDIYIKPKDNFKKKSIKEIKIQNKLTPKASHTNINSYYSFNKVNNKDIKKSNDRIKNNEQNNIKKIYIKRGTQITNVFNYSNISHYNSTFINFKADNEKDINDILLIKEIQTLDNRIFINIKYIALKNKNTIRQQIKKLYNRKNIQIARLYSISIIKNKISLNKELYENLKMYNLGNYKGIVDYCLFDNDKNKNLKNIINLINKIKNIIAKKILKLLSKRYAKKILIKDLLMKKYKREINKYFFRFITNSFGKNNKIIKTIYHKINYNDDFNTNNRFQTPKSFNKFKKIYNSKPHILTQKNSNNQINFRKKIIDKHLSKDSFSNTTYKTQNKKANNNQTNQIYHNQTKTNINRYVNI